MRLTGRRLAWRGVAVRQSLASHRVRAAGTAAVVQAALALLLAFAPSSPLHASAAPAGTPHAAAAPAVAVAPLRLAATPTAVAAPTRLAATAAVAPATPADQMRREPSAVRTPASAVLAAAIAGSPDTSGDLAARDPALRAPARRLATVAAPAGPTATATPTASPTATATATTTPTPTVTPTETPNPFGNDTLTNLNKVPDAQDIYWAQYIPAPVGVPVPGVKGTGQFIMPVAGWVSTQYSATHLAIDIAGQTGSPVVAADSGTVVFAGIDYGGLGYAVEIDHGNGMVSAYGHNSELEVKVGQIVRRGDLIALRGSTGHSTGPHVHFAIHRNGTPVNPFDYLLNGNPPAPIPQVQVPKLTGLTQADAAAAIKSLTLQLVLDPAQASADVPAGRLAVQQPAAGQLANVDSAVHIAISSGAPPPTLSPSPSPTPTAVITTSTSSTAASTGVSITAAGTTSTFTASATRSTEQASTSTSRIPATEPTAEATVRPAASPTPSPRPAAAATASPRPGGVPVR